MPTSRNWITVNVHVTLDDLIEGDWTSRETNPIALAIKRHLCDGVTLFVDVREEEFYIRGPGSAEHTGIWGNLDDEVKLFAGRVYRGTETEELQFPFSAPTWAFRERE